MKPRIVRSITLACSLVLAMLARLIFKEKIGRRLAAVVVMIAGAWLLLYSPT